MKYRHTHDNSAVSALFGHDIEVPDKLGTVLRSYKHDTYIVVICEHGIHMHPLTKRDPQMMMRKGKRAMVLNSLAKQKC